MYISKKHFEDIATFNDIIGNLHGDALPANPKYRDNLESQVKIVRSEIGELEDAMESLIGMIFTGEKPSQEVYDLVRDGLADVLVTGSGLAHRLGFDEDNLVGMTEVFECSWLPSDRPQGTYRFDQLPLWAVPRIDFFLSWFDEGIQLLQNASLDEYEDAAGAVVCRVLRIFYWVNMIARCIGCDLEADLEAVNSNNMAKFSATKEQSDKTIAKFAGIDVVVEAEFRDDGYVVHVVKENNSADIALQSEYPAGKLVKPVGFSKVILPKMEIPDIV